MLADLKYAGRSLWWNYQFHPLNLQNKFLKGWAKRGPSTYNHMRNFYRWLTPNKMKSEPQDITLPPIPARGSIITVDGIRLRLHESLSDESIRHLASGKHTEHERNLLLDFLEPTDIVLELGGGIGMLAIAIAKKIGSDRVFSFEGNPAVEPIVRENFSLNGVSPTMEFCILDREPGSQTFYTCNEFNRSSTNRVLESDIPIEVPVKSIELTMKKIEPTFLIMDIQGSEDGLLENVDFSGLSKVMVEYHPSITGMKRVNQLRKFVRSQGFVEINKRHTCILYSRSSRRDRNGRVSILQR